MQTNVRLKVLSKDNWNSLCSSRDDVHLQQKTKLVNNLWIDWYQFRLSLVVIRQPLIYEILSEDMYIVQYEAYTCN
jgi:hypothetical protein